MNKPSPIQPTGLTRMCALWLAALLLTGLSPLVAAAEAAPGAAPATPAAGAAPATAPATGGGAGDASGGAAGAPAGGVATGTRALDQQIQDLKKDVIDLNRDLFVLEE